MKNFLLTLIISTKLLAQEGQDLDSIKAINELSLVAIAQICPDMLFPERITSKIDTERKILTIDAPNFSQEIDLDGMFMTSMLNSFIIGQDRGKARKFLINEVNEFIVKGRVFEKFGLARAKIEMGKVIGPLSDRGECTCSRLANNIPILDQAARLRFVYTKSPTLAPDEFKYSLALAEYSLAVNRKSTFEVVPTKSIEVKVNEVPQLLKNSQVESALVGFPLSDSEVANAITSPISVLDRDRPWIYIPVKQNGQEYSLKGKIKIMFCYNVETAKPYRAYIYLLSPRKDFVVDFNL